MISLQSVEITGFLYNIYTLSLKRLWGLPINLQILRITIEDFPYVTREPRKHLQCSICIRVVQWSVGGDSSTRYVHLTFSLFHFIPPFIGLFIIYFFYYIFHKFQVNLPKMMFVLSNYADICNKIHILMLFSLLEVRKVISFLAFLKKIQIFGGKTKEVTL